MEVTEQEKIMFQCHIDSLQKCKDQMIFEFIGACNEINRQIKVLEDKKKRKDCNTMEKRDIAKALLEINAQCVKSNFKCNKCTFCDLCNAAELNTSKPKMWNFKELINIAYGKFRPVERKGKEC